MYGPCDDEKYLPPCDPQAPNAKRVAADTNRDPMPMQAYADKVLGDYYAKLRDGTYSH